MAREDATKQASEKVRFTHFRRDRRELLDLFKLADDSEAQINRYMELGDLIVANANGAILGLVQVIETGEPGTLEIKSIAVEPAHHRLGIGSKLLNTAVRHARRGGAKRLKLSTSIAAFDTLRFYLRYGFRLCGYTRDAFNSEQGYPEGTKLDGIPLNDAVEFDLILTKAAGPKDGKRR
jgi:ribosomal protein S18 acetylase RimI-like enzyme